MLSFISGMTDDWPAANMWYRGTIDFAVVPYGVSITDAGKHIRVGIVCKVRMQQQQHVHCEWSAAHHDVRHHDT